MSKFFIEKIDNTYCNSQMNYRIFKRRDDSITISFNIEKENREKIISLFELPLHIFPI